MSIGINSPPPRYQMKIPPIPPALDNADPNKIQINPMISCIVMGKNAL